MGDRGALDRFTIELYKTAKEMSIENSKNVNIFRVFNLLLTYSFLYTFAEVYCKPTRSVVQST